MTAQGQPDAGAATVAEGGHSGPWLLVKEWPYRRADGGELAAYHGRHECQCPRCDGAPKREKKFLWRLPDHMYDRGLQAQVRIADLDLYQPVPIAERPDEVVYAVEGEQSADVAATRGLLAVSLPGGAGQRNFGMALEQLQGRSIVVIADNDAPGRALAAALSEASPSARVLDLPDLPEHGDLVEFLEGWLDPDGSRHPGRTLSDLERLIAAVMKHDEASAPWQPSTLIEAAEVAQAARNTLVDRYADYAAMPTDAPRTFHEALALCALSVVAGRRAVLRLAHADVYAILWILILADSTLYRKSTALDLQRELVDLVDHDRLTANDFTPQRFVAILAENDGHPLLFTRDEVSGFLEGLNKLDFMSGLKETLCNVYDGRPFRREKMKPKAKEGEAPPDDQWKYDVREPFLSIAVATTVERFTDVAQVGDVHSGFFPRFGVVLPPDQVPERRPIRAIDDEIESARSGLVKEFRSIADEPIHLTCESDVLERFDRYVEELEREAQDAPSSNVVAIIASRCSWMAFRVAMLLAVADGTQRVSLLHLLRGIEIVEGWRHNALTVLNRLAPSQFERQAARFVQLVESKPGITRRDAMRALKLNRRLMDDLEATCKERGEITVEEEKTRGGRSKSPRARHRSLSSC